MMGMMIATTTIVVAITITHLMKTDHCSNDNTLPLWKVVFKSLHSQ